MSVDQSRNDFSRDFFGRGEWALPAALAKFFLLSWQPPFSSGLWEQYQPPPPPLHLSYTILQTYFVFKITLGAPRLECCRSSSNFFVFSTFDWPPPGPPPPHSTLLAPIAHLHGTYYSTQNLGRSPSFLVEYMLKNHHYRDFIYVDAISE